MTDLNRKIKHWVGMVAGASRLYDRSFGSMLSVVAFHRVDDEIGSGPITCTAETFEDFCRFFKRHFDVVPLREQVVASREGRAMGGSLSITFDDGYRDNYEVAAPILKDLGLHATFFLTSGFIESNVVPFWDEELASPPKWMSWQQVRSLSDDGFEIGCHTHTHIDMGKAPVEKIRSELRTSRRMLEEHTGKPVTLFAYPFGARGNIRDEAVQVVREEGFECCVSCCGGRNDAIADNFHLNRLPISDWFISPHQMGAELMLGRF